MGPVHSIEYELTTELAANIQRTLLRWQLRRGWRRDLLAFITVLGVAGIIIWLWLGEWIPTGMGAVLLFVVVFFGMVSIARRWSRARAGAATAILGLYSSDRRVHIELADERVRLETEFFRGEGAWTELDAVVVFDGFWALLLSNGGQIVIPGSMMSGELEKFLRAKARQVMAPVHEG